MTFSRVLCLNLILMLCVHGSEVVARIRFQSSHYTVSEESPNICIPVENVAAPATQDFPVSYSFDAVLVGSQDQAPLSSTPQGTIRFSAESSTSDLCFTHFDDDIACEPDIVGQVRLINSSGVVVIDPAIATVTIKDDDPASVGFQKSTYQYSEDGLTPNQSFPIVQSSHPSLPIILQISEAQHSTIFVSPSLTVPDIPLSVTSVDEIFQLAIQDDNVALEAPELVILELSVNFQMTCSEFDFTPYKQTQIIIVDNDRVTIGLAEQEIVVKESARNVEVCVRISTTIARLLAFKITTRNGMAKSGEDFAEQSITGQFMPMSEQTEICYDIPVTFDSVVEPIETFSVHLSIESTFPNEVRDKLTVANAVTNVVIQDTSDYYRLVLDGQSNISPHFVPESSTVCFNCAAPEPIEATGILPGVLWRLVGDEQLKNGDHFQNGHVLSNGTLLIMNSSKFFNFDSVSAIGCANNLDDTTISEPQPVAYFDIILGAPPLAVSLVSSDTSSSPSNSTPNPRQVLTCIYEGVPGPSVEWLQNNRPVNGDHSSVESVVLERENRYKSVLSLPRDVGAATYTCACRNQFGASQRSITLTDRGVIGSIMSGSKALKMAKGLIVTVSLFVCLFAS